ncbi:hypothetical protein J4416_02665 [Candidatus Pacearchaeota archaeon]|nr:hypothetical protein [Candidatus Pacearchaeota archaeon]
MLNNKKGVSEVVANVLIVLLVIVGIAVIWSVVKPTIDKGAKGINSDCFTLQIEPVSCVKDGNAYKVNIKRNPGAGVFDAVELVFEDADGGSDRFSPKGANVVTSASLGELETKIILGTTALTPTKVNTVITVGGNLCQITTQPVDCTTA